MFFSVSKPAPTLDNDRSHYAALCTLSREEQWAVKYLYDRLGIIDSKMSSLLRLNGIIIGFVTVAVFKVAEKPDIVGWPILFLLACISIFFLLAYAEIIGAQIFYLAFDRVTPRRSVELYRETMMGITIQRERRYRSALWCSVIGILFFILVFTLVAGAEMVALWHRPASA